MEKQVISKTKYASGAAVEAALDRTTIAEEYDANVSVNWNIGAGFIFKGTGKVSAHASYSYTDFISVSANEYYYAEPLTIGGNAIIAFYTAANDTSYVSGADVSTLDNRYGWSVPNNAEIKYMRISDRATSDMPQVKKTAYSYTPVPTYVKRELSSTNTKNDFLVLNVLGETTELSTADGGRDLSGYSIKNNILAADTSGDCHIFKVGKGLRYRAYGVCNVLQAQSVSLRSAVGVSGATTQKVASSSGTFEVYGTTTNELQYVAITTDKNSTNYGVEAYKSANVNGFEDLKKESESNDRLSVSNYDVIAHIRKSIKYRTKTLDKCLIAFFNDDVNKDMGGIVDLFISKGLPLNIAAIPESLNVVCNDSRTVLQQCQRVEANGGEIVCHSTPYLSSASTESDFVQYFCKNKKILLDTGLNVRGYVKAGGGDNNPNMSLLEKYMYPNFVYGSGFTYCNDVLFNQTRNALSQGVSAVKNLIDNAISNHTAIMFYGHGSSDQGSNWIADMTEILDYILAKDSSTYSVVTLGELIKADTELSN